MSAIVEKIEKAVRLIQVFYESANVDFVEVAYSGGKDSDVILELTRMSGVPYKAYYKNTTIDPPHTLQHVKEMGVEVLQPKHKFFDLVAQMGFPNRFRRFCCRELKEYKVLDKVIIGVRADESRKRAEMYKEPTDCRIYGRNERAEALYPILFWNTEDIEAFIRERGVILHPLYYDEAGQLCLDRRLGCMCCPLAGHKKRMLQFKQYPNMLKAYARAGQKYMDSHRTEYQSVYEWLCRDILSKSTEEWMAFKYSLFAQRGVGGNDFYKEWLTEMIQTTK